ncbi:MAG: MATE family efflux transporter [Lentisphaerae bacterium]|nr:MATE family efflux transporter [Lentisphaerota bacterium]
MKIDLPSLHGHGGIADVSKVAFPLVIASIGHGVNLFTDRVMLSNYSEAAMAAAFPSGLTSFTMSCIFLGIVGYAGVFVAQYTGAGQPKNVGKAVWQAIFLALIGGAVMALTTIRAKEIFSWYGHDPALQPMEVEYYQILSWCGFVPLVSAALSSFWSGRAKTRFIMIVNLLITLFNIPLNAMLIFGLQVSFGSWDITIPEMGIAGAAWGTTGAGSIGLAAYLIGFGTKSARREFGTWDNPFSWDIFKRLIRFGTPNGVQLVLDLATFNIFVVLLGKISVDILTASTVAMSAYSLAFNPMIGFGQAASILVGQGIGAKDTGFAERSVRSCRFLVICYSAVMMIIFIIFPEVIFRMFDLGSDKVRHLSRIMLIFTSGYLLFDAFNILYGNAVKGAGDTKFVMWVGIALGWLLYALPCTVAYFTFSSQWAIGYFGMEAAQNICVWTLWWICDIYIILLGGAFYLRYRHGKWKKMNVID